jgi:serpin B
MVFSMAACATDPDVLSSIGGQSGETAELTATAKLSVTPLVPSQTNTAAEYASFRKMAIELFKETSNASAEENLLISPVSIMTALAMTAQGAEDETLAQFEDFFGSDAVRTASLLTDYADTISMHNEEAKVSIANSVWLRDDAERLMVEDAFLAKSKNMRAEIFRSAFNQGTVNDINKWVRENTDGMIDSIINEIPDSAVLYLVNALSFDSKWEEKYQKNQIHDGKFTTADGKKQAATFMNSEEKIFLKDDKATGFIKPYRDGFNFVAILPNEDVSLKEYITGMNGETLKNLIEGGKDVYTVQTSIPKFKNEASENMIPVLNRLGLTEMFDADTADFGAMATSSRGNIYISNVMHKAFIEVDTNGTRATAVTLIEATDECAIEMESVTLNRPFIYMIVDSFETESLPLFIGTIETLN